MPYWQYHRELIPTGISQEKSLEILNALGHECWELVFQNIMIGVGCTYWFKRPYFLTASSDKKIFSSPQGEAR